MPTYQFHIEATPTYLSCTEEAGQSVYQFAYAVTFTNTGSVPAQLISRHWIITDADNQVQEVRGLGVVGKQPLLQPGESFEYTSGSSLTTAVGTMKGSYQMAAEDVSAPDRRRAGRYRGRVPPRSSAGWRDRPR